MKYLSENGGLNMSCNHISDVICRKMEHIYQPMWRIPSMQVFGYEALVRFPEEPYTGSIEQIFETARSEGTLYDVDTKSIMSAITGFSLSNWNKELLFINIYPSTLLHQQFPLFIQMLVKKCPYIRNRVVLELSESIAEDYCWDQPHIKERIALIRENGFLIALDDVGKGGAGLQKIIEFSPDFIKLDRYFSNQLSASKEKQQMISLFMQYAKQKMEVILEGLEEEVDLVQAKNLDVQVVQGYLLGRPQKLTAY